MVVRTLVLSLVNIVEDQKGCECATSNKAVNKLVHKGGLEFSCLRHEEVSFVVGQVKLANLIGLLYLLVVLVRSLPSSDMLPLVLVQYSDSCLAETALQYD